MELKTINEILQVLSGTTPAKLKKLNSKITHQGIPDGSYDGVQGEYNERDQYFSHDDLPENTFFKLTYQTDSYGYNEHIVGAAFVEGKEKKITVYEPV